MSDKFRVALILAILIAALAPLAIASVPRDSVGDNHPLDNLLSPIIVSSEQDLANLSLPGNGTLANPYVIANLRLYPINYCIAIANTRAHLIIRNCTLKAFDGIELSLTNVSNVRVENCTIQAAGDGVYISNSTNIVMINCTLDASTPTLHQQGGFHLNDVADCDIEGNRLTNGVISVETAENTTVRWNRIKSFSVGISIWNVPACVIEGNVIDGNDAGLVLVNSSSSILRGNSLINCGLATGIGTHITAYNRSEFELNISEDNTVNGKKLGYFLESSPQTIDGDEYGQIFLIGCKDVTVVGGSLHDANTGVSVGFSSNCQIVDTRFENLGNAISIFKSTNCVVINCTSNAIISDEFPSGTSIVSWNSTGCTIENSTIRGGHIGMLLEECDSFRVAGNVFENMSYGVMLWDVTNSVVVHNFFIHTIHGLLVESQSSNNVFYENVFWNIQWEAARDGGVDNQWDFNGVGNYWEDAGLVPYRIPGTANSTDNHPIKLWDLVWDGERYVPVTDMPLWLTLALIGLALATVVFIAGIYRQIRR